MRRTFYLIFTFLNIWFCYSQNDTIYIEKDYVMLGNIKFNQIDQYGQKNGKWIHYKLTEGSSMDIVHSDGDLWSSNETIYYEYRPLQNNEHNGKQVLITEKVDSVIKKIEATYQIVYNKIPETKYFIKSEGQYLSDNKNGIWTYYHENGVISKTINYKNGYPDQDFTMYRNDKTLMMTCEKVEDNLWQVRKFSKEGKLLSEELKKLDDLKEIY